VTKAAGVLVSGRRAARCRCWFGQGGGRERAGSRIRGGRVLVADRARVGVLHAPSLRRSDGVRQRVCRCARIRVHRARCRALLGSRLVGGTHPVRVVVPPRLPLLLRLLLLLRPSLSSRPPSPSRCVRMGPGSACALGLSREEGGAGRARWVKGRAGGSCRGWEGVDREEAEAGVVVRRRWEGPGVEGAGVDVDGAVVLQLLLLL
jgi:hypothetical protein